MRRELETRSFYSPEEIEAMNRLAERARDDERHATALGQTTATCGLEGCAAVVEGSAEYDYGIFFVPFYCDEHAEFRFLTERQVQQAKILARRAAAPGGDPPPVLEFLHDPAPLFDRLIARQGGALPAVDVLVRKAGGWDAVLGEHDQLDHSDYEPFKKLVLTHARWLVRRSWSRTRPPARRTRPCGVPRARARQPRRRSRAPSRGDPDEPDVASRREAAT